MSLPVRLNEWLGKLPSTNAITAVGLYLSAVYVHTLLVADMMGRPIKDGTQATLGFFISAMLGVGLGQFSVKRKTDAGHVEAQGKVAEAKARATTMMQKVDG